METVSDTKSASDLTVLAPAFYRNPEWSTRYLSRSATRHNVPIRWYGTGEQYTGWVQVQVTRLLYELEENVSTGCVLYTDSSDAMFMSGVEEIMEKYAALGSPPMLVSMEPDGMCAGGWMGWTSYIAEMLRSHVSKHPDSNPQQRWRELIGSGVVGAMPDTDGDVFHVVGAHSGRLSIRGKRLYDGVTGSVPSIVHWAGGYTCPVIGKAAMIEPWWVGLGYQSTVHMDELEIVE